MEAHILTSHIYFNSVHLGKPIQRIDLPKECHFLGLIRDQKLLYFHENPTVKEGDLLLVIAINPYASDVLNNILELRCFKKNFVT